MQRALIRYFDPKNQAVVEEALIKARRTDLIGNSPECLIKGSNKFHQQQKKKAPVRSAPGKQTKRFNDGKKKKR